MFDRLDKSLERYEEIRRLLSDPLVISDQQRFRELGKELRSLELIVKSYERYKKMQSDFRGARELLESVQDPEMKALAQEEYDKLKGEIEATEEELKLLLVPQDPNDTKNLIMGVRAGTGGGEAGPFSAYLLPGYTPFS